MLTIHRLKNMIFLCGLAYPNGFESLVGCHHLHQMDLIKQNNKFI